MTGNEAGMITSEILPSNDQILGVKFKLLKTFGDERGFFREIFRATEPIFDNGRFMQWSHSKMGHNVVKAWHYHHIQREWWYIPFGHIEMVLFDYRKESPTFREKLVFHLGETSKYGPSALEACVHIPPGVLHGCKVLSSEAHLFYMMTETYNTNDEGRVPFDSAEVGHPWGENVIVADNDRKTFVPTAERLVLR